MAGAPAPAGLRADGRRRPWWRLRGVRRRRPDPGSPDRPDDCSPRRPRHASDPAGRGTAPAPPVADREVVACQGGAGPKGYQCATVMVPRDPGHPDDAADRRWPSTGSRQPVTKIGSLLVNPGGPGVSGVDFLPDAVAEMPADLLASFDIVGFDPARRGPHRPDHAARTAPGWTGTSPPTRRPPTPAGFAALVAGRPHPRRRLRGPEPGRTALREHRRRGPGHGRAARGPGRRQAHLPRLLLRDASSAPPTPVFSRPTSGPWSSTAPSTPPCRPSPRWTNSPQPSTPSCRRSSPPAPSPNRPARGSPAGNPTAAFEALLARVRANPLPARHTSRTVGPAAVLYGAAQALYWPTTWPDLASALQAAVRRRRDRLPRARSILHAADSANGTYSNMWRPTPPSTAWTPRPSPSPAIQADAARSRGGRARVRAARPLRRGRSARSGRCRRPGRSARSGPPGRRRSWSSAAPATRSRPTPGPRPSAGELAQRRAADPGRRRPHRRTGQLLHPDRGRPLPDRR